jgi:N-formylmaleamate deformylase
MSDNAFAETEFIEGYATVEERAFHYTRTGHGNKPPLVLLHGFSDNGFCWLPVARDLEAHYDVIMPDARGHGLSVRLQPNQPLDNAADVAGLITALELHRPVIVGHSMGGSTATEVGARYPNLTSGLVLEDPAWIDPAPDDVPLRDNSFFEWLLTLDEVSLSDIIARGKTNNPAWSEVEFPAWAASKRQLDKTIFEVINVRKPWREFVSAFTIPVLLITADVEKGAIVSPAVAEEAVSLSPLLQVAPVPGAGHNIRRENYPAFMHVLQTFLSQLTRSDTE